MSLWIQSNLNFPLSGSVNQKLDPDMFFGTIDSSAGDGEIEKEVFFKVAAYGKQLGLLTELILAMAEEKTFDEQTAAVLQQLKSINSKIETIKLSKQGCVKAKAKSALEELKSQNPAEFNSLITEYQGDE